MPEAKPAYDRILLKLSGESLLGRQPYGIDFDTAKSISQEIKEVRDLGVQVAIMIGGGNIFRGVRGIEGGMERASADQMGLLATVINGIALQDALEHEGVFTRHVSALEIRAIAEPFIRLRVIRHLEKGRVVIFAAGTGNPYMTTDTAAALRAIETGAEVLLMAKNRVDGIYDSDPQKNPRARRFDHLTHDEALKLRPEVMDTTAFALCLENKLPIIVFDLRAKDSIERAVAGEPIGTRVQS